MDDAFWVEKLKRAWALQHYFEFLWSCEFEIGEGFFHHLEFIVEGVFWEDVWMVYLLSFGVVEEFAQIADAKLESEVKVLFVFFEEVVVDNVGVGELY